jgi:hypothetical protein
VPKLIQAVIEGNPAQVVRMSHGLTIKDSIHAPSLRTLEKEYGKDDLATVVSFLILQTARYFNLGNNITEDQALETAYLILQTYPYESIEDFILMFNRAKGAKYGEVYNRLDGHTIFRWMEKYLEEKAEYREKLHQGHKFGSGGENFLKTIQNKALELEAPEVPQNTKSVIDALKEAINYKDDEKNEIDYMKFKTEYIKKNT